MAQPILYQFTVCPFCCKVRAALDYKGVSYRTVEVNPVNKREIAFSEKYKKVPIYINSFGEQINDSTPILHHLDEEFNEPRLFEEDQEKALREQEWLAWSEILARGLPPLIYQSFGKALKAFSYITEKGNFSWVQRKMIQFSGAFVMTMVAKKTARRQGITDPKRHFVKLLEKWAKAIGEGPTFNGERINAVDVTVYGYLQSISGLSDFEHVRANPTVWKWYTYMEKQLKDRAGQVSKARNQREREEVGTGV